MSASVLGRDFGQLNDCDSKVRALQDLQALHSDYLVPDDLNKVDNEAIQELLGGLKELGLLRAVSFKPRAHDYGVGYCLGQGDFVDTDISIVQTHNAILSELPDNISGSFKPLELTEFTQAYVSNQECVKQYVAVPQGSHVNTVLGLFAQSAHDEGHRRGADGLDQSSTPGWKSKLKLQL